MCALENQSAQMKTIWETFVLSCINHGERRGEDFQDGEWADCLGTSVFWFFLTPVSCHHPLGDRQQGAEGTEGIVPRPNLRPGPAAPGGLSRWAVGPGGPGWRSGGAPSPQSLSKRDATGWTWGVPPMPAAVRGILFNVLGGGGYTGIGRGRYSFGYKEINS